MSPALLVSETRVLFTQVAVELVDDFTGAVPIGLVEVSLQAQDGASWRVVDLEPTRTSMGVVAFPGLGLTSRPDDKPTRTYRVQVWSRVYLPLYGTAYPAAQDGHTFVVHPWDHRTPPAVTPAQPERIFLVGRPALERPATVPVLRGRVVDPAGMPVADVLVEEGTRERALTDERGQFSLPLRWVPSGTTVTIDARDRLGRLGHLNVAVPADLGVGHDITVS